MHSKNIEIRLWYEHHWDAGYLSFLMIVGIPNIVAHLSELCQIALVLWPTRSPSVSMCGRDGQGNKLTH